MPPPSIPERVLGSVARHALLTLQMRLGVAVSGGADSIFLLHLLHRLAPHWNLKLSVVHLDHGLRGDASRQDAEFVRNQAAKFGLDFHLKHANLQAGNVEQEARRERHNFFSELLAANTVDRIATGHTRSDQAETVLYRILRGSGLAGLRGVLPLLELPQGGALIRPLLDLDRSEIKAWLRSESLEWREDATNRDPAYARNRLRHEILPLLRAEFNPHLDQALAQLAVLAQDEEQWAAGQVVPPPCRAGAVYLSVRELTANAPALARRQIRLALEQVKGDLRQLDFAHVETVLEMARSTQGSGRAQLPGIDVYRSFEALRLAPAGFDSRHPRDWDFPVPIPGEVILPASGTAVKFQVDFHLAAERPEPQDGKVRDELDWPRLAFFPDRPLTLRNWRPGDCYRPVRARQQQKLKFLFEQARIPLWERRTWPVLLFGDEIVWTRRFGPSAAFAANQETREVLRIREHESPGT